MDVSVYFLLFLLACSTSQAIVEDADGLKEPANDVATPSAPTNPTTDTPPPVGKNCTTARNASGSCVQRADCEYSTAAVDFTLYAPKGYVKTCKSEEVCCPQGYIVLEKHKPVEEPQNDDPAYEFDDDDYN